MRPLTLIVTAVALVAATAVVTALSLPPRETSPAPALPARTAIAPTTTPAAPDTGGTTTAAVATTAAGTTARGGGPIDEVDAIALGARPNNEALGPQQMQVLVDRPGHHVVLVVGADGDCVRWSVRASDGTDLVRIILGGTQPQLVDAAPAQTAIEARYWRAVEPAAFLPLPTDLASPAFRSASRAIEQHVGPLQHYLTVPIRVGRMVPVVTVHGDTRDPALALQDPPLAPLGPPVGSTPVPAIQWRGLGSPHPQAALGALVPDGTWTHDDTPCPAGTLLAAIAGDAGAGICLLPGHHLGGIGTPLPDGLAQPCQIPSIGRVGAYTALAWDGSERRALFGTTARTIVAYRPGAPDLTTLGTVEGGPVVALAVAPAPGPIHALVRLKEGQLQLVELARAGGVQPGPRLAIGPGLRGDGPGDQLGLALVQDHLLLVVQTAEVVPHGHLPLPDRLLGWWIDPTSGTCRLTTRLTR